MHARAPVVMTSAKTISSGARSVRDADLHRIEVTSHIGGVDVGYRHIEPCPMAADFLGRRDDGLGAAQYFAHRVAARHVPQGAMLDLSRRPTMAPLP